MSRYPSPTLGDKNEIMLRLKFDENADIYLSDFYLKLSQILMGFHVNVDIEQDIILIPNIDALGLSYDNLLEKLKQIMNKYDIFKGRIVNRCEIHMNKDHVLVILVPVYVRNISSLNDSLTELLGLQPNSTTVSSEVVFLQIGTCISGYEFEAESIIFNVDSFLKESSAFVTLYWDSIELVDSRSSKPSLLSPTIQTEFKFDGVKASKRISGIMMLEDNASSSVDDISALGIVNRSREESLLEDFNQYFSSLSNISPFSNSGHSENLASGQLSFDAIRSKEASSSSIFSFSDSPLHVYPEAGSSSTLPHFSNGPGIGTSKSPSSNGLNLSGSPSRDIHSVPNSQMGFPPSGQSASYMPHNQYGFSARSPTKPITSSDQQTDRDYLTNSRPSSQLNNPWSDTTSDIIDAPYDIYRGYPLANTRQRQHSDPIFPSSRGRQHSDPTTPSGYNPVVGPYGSSRPIFPSHSMSTTPDRKPSIDGQRQSVTNFFPRPPPANLSVELDGRGRSISESATLAEVHAMQHYQGVNPGINPGFNSNRGILLTCPSCHANVKRNQSVCLRCHCSLPVIHAASHNDMRSLQSYSSYPSDSSLNSDSYSHHSGMYDSHRDNAMREGDWICSYCRGHNFATKIACFTCHAARPGFERGIPASQMEALGIGRLGGPSAEAKPGDWTCPKCHENVFAKRNRCYRCTTSRPRKLSH